MSDKGAREKRRGPVPLAELVGKVVDPVIARRGFATADLISAWPAIVGQAYAECTQPERILWPRGREGAEPAPGVLFLKVDGPRAIFLQHELPQILERINALLGYGAIGQVRISQGAVQTRTRPAKRPSDPLSPAGVYFGTSTGTVYHTRNSGDAWHTLAANLPPVYSVTVAQQ